MATFGGPRAWGTAARIPPSLALMVMIGRTLASMRLWRRSKKCGFLLDGASGRSEDEDTRDSGELSEHGLRHVHGRGIQGFIGHVGGVVCQGTTLLLIATPWQPYGIRSSDFLTIR